MAKDIKKEKWKLNNLPLLKKLFTKHFDESSNKKGFTKFCDELYDQTDTNENSLKKK
jgi:hypothetical protein